MLDTLVIEVNLHNVHQMGHLSKNQDSVIKGLEFGQQPIKHFEFPRTSENPIMIGDVIVVAQKQVRMVAAFTQLHHQVG